MYQDLALIPALSIWRNFFLGRELKVGRWPLRFLNKKRMRRITMENLREMGLTRLRSPDEPVDILSGGERQALAIARARYFGGTLLLLDEPTSALSVKETEKVSEAVQIARNSGLGVVIIDHNIAHVHRICDRIVIMESGRILKSVRAGGRYCGTCRRFGRGATCALNLERGCKQLSFHGVGEGLDPLIGHQFLETR